MQKNYCFFDFTCYNITYKSGVVLVNGCTLVFLSRYWHYLLFLFLLIIHIFPINSIDFMYEQDKFFHYTKRKAT